MKKVIIVLIIWISFFSFLSGCINSDESNGGEEFVFTALDGSQIHLSDYRGKVVILDLWATWCNPCRVEMPYIQEVFEDGKGVGLVLLAINVGETSSKVKEFMEKNGLSFPVLLDTDTSVAQDYNVRGIPSTFFIDKDGIIKDRKIGAFSSKADLDWRLINSILAGE